MPIRFATAVVTHADTVAQYPAPTDADGNPYNDKVIAVQARFNPRFQGAVSVRVEFDNDPSLSNGGIEVVRQQGAGTFYRWYAGSGGNSFGGITQFVDTRDSEGNWTRTYLNSDVDTGHPQGGKLLHVKVPPDEDGICLDRTIKVKLMNVVRDPRPMHISRYSCVGNRDEMKIVVLDTVDCERRL